MIYQVNLFFSLYFSGEFIVLWYQVFQGCVRWSIAVDWKIEAPKICFWPWLSPSEHQHVAVKNPSRSLRAVNWIRRRWFLIRLSQFYSDLNLVAPSAVWRRSRAWFTTTLWWHWPPQIIRSTRQLKGFFENLWLRTNELLTEPSVVEFQSVFSAWVPIKLCRSASWSAVTKKNIATI